MAAFYVNGENIYWTSLSDLRAGRTKHVVSETWDARDGIHQIAVAVYPASHFDYSLNSAWRRLDKGAALAFAEETYRYVALPNLVIEYVNVAARKQTDGDGTGRFYLDASYYLRNAVAAVPVRSPFEVQVKWESDAECPFSGETMSQCFVSVDFNDFSGRERNERAKGSNALSLPETGVKEYRLVIVADAGDDVNETSESDNRYEARVTVGDDGSVLQASAAPAETPDADGEDCGEGAFELDAPGGYDGWRKFLYAIRPPNLSAHLYADAQRGDAVVNESGGLVGVYDGAGQIIGVYDSVRIVSIPYESD